MIRDIPFSDAVAVSAIRYRLAPIDVGFDLRAEGVPIRVSRRDDPIRISYADARGERRVIEGAQDAVLRSLRARGYRFEVA